MLAWNAVLFDRITEWLGRYVVAACLICRANGLHFVFASAYGPTVPTVQGELWEDLI